MQIITRKRPIWIASAPVDFRQSINGLCEIIENQFDCVPHEVVFVFFNQARNRLKILFWHCNGYVLLYKRFEYGRLRIGRSKNDRMLLHPEQLNALLQGLDWKTIMQFGQCDCENYC